MNREILFKAKRKDDGEWVEGYYLNVAKINHFICTGKIKLNGAVKGILAPEMYAIDPDTLCQYTGLTDKNGQKIWEGDIVTCSKRRRIEGYDMYKVVWRKDFADFGVEPLMYGAQYPIGFVFGGSLYGRDYKVIGNIFDNPELLEVE